MSDLNPYQPVADGLGGQPSGGSRSVFMLVIVSALGTVAGGLALLIAGESLLIAQRQGIDGDMVKGLVVSLGFALLATSWAYAFQLYWQKRNRWATGINFGTLACAGMFLLLLEHGVVP